MDINILSYSRTKGVTLLKTLTQPEAKLATKEGLLSCVAAREAHDADVIFAVGRRFKGGVMVLKDTLAVPKKSGLVTFGHEKGVTTTVPMDFRIKGEGYHEDLMDQVTEAFFEEAINSLWITVTIDYAIWVVKGRKGKPYLLASTSAL